MSDKLICPICGKPTNVYMGNARKDRLCKEHGKQANAGEIKQCPNCGRWSDKGKECECEKPKSAKVHTDELTCIACGKPSNGKHFCLDCYKKYHDREIEIHFKNCVESYVSDEYCNTKFKCKDGRLVRSKSEKIISDFLFDYHIRAVYEKLVFYYPEKGEPIELHPDFYLPDKDIYIEHNGLNTNSYKSNKAKTAKMYEDLKYTVVITVEKDLEDIEAKLKPILKIN